MKPLGQLTVEDLVANPVWRYEGGTGEEALVAPARRETLSREDDEVFLAATEFELPDASRHFGFCFPADDSGIDYLQPVIVVGSRHVAFWFDGAATPEALASQWKALGRGPADVFPVRFRCVVPVDGRIVTGSIEGIECSRSEHPPSRSMSSASAPGESEAEKTPPATGPEKTLTARPVGARRRGASTVEKRTTRRRKAEMSVEFSQGSLQGTGVTGDVSRRGMFVRSTRIPGTGPVLRLTVNLPEGRKLVLTGKVVRSAGPGWPAASTPGFGLKLADEWPEYEDLFGRQRNNKPE